MDMMDMDEPDDEARHRQAVIRLLDLTSAGTKHCRGCGKETECFVKRRKPSGDTKPRCLECWKAER
jgi:hypothetical protein